MRPELQRQLDLLRCPASGERLVADGAGWLHTAGGKRYPLVDNVPILVDREQSLFYNGQGPAEPREADGKVADLLRWSADLPPTISYNVGSRRNFGRVAGLLRERASELERRIRVLVVGGQTLGVGAGVLLDSPDFEVFETDVEIGPRTAIVCDGHNLPFADGSFDAVVIQAVLSWVIDPYRVAAEIHRVLADDGLVYSEAPFLQPVSGGAFDFMRFTHLGHLSLWRWFDELDSGAHGGPAMTLLWAFESFLQACVGQSRIMRALCRRLVSVFLFWVKYLDRWLVHRPAGIDAASGTFFLGRRRTTPVDDRTLLRRYRGVGPCA